MRSKAEQQMQLEILELRKHLSRVVKKSCECEGVYFWCGTWDDLDTKIEHKPDCPYVAAKVFLEG
jgi:hypothetical protein